MIERESQKRWKARLLSEIGSSRVPLSVSIELVWSCNLHCQHCYLGDLRSQGDYLPLDFLTGLLEQLAAAGCLSLVITGGEPLLHPQFAQFYRRAVEMGFFVSLFTNGRLVDAALADLLAKYPPHHVEISLYGGSAETYAKITGSAEAFAQVLGGIDFLVARGVEVYLKAMLISGLKKDLPAMRLLASERGLNLTLDPVIDGDLSGNTDSYDCRIDSSAAVALEFGEPRREQKICLYDEQHGPQAQVQNLTCGAAHSACHIDPKGFLLPCVMLREPAFDLRQADFATAWIRLADTFPVRHPDDSPCATCEIQHLCNYCPGVASHVLGDQELARVYYCNIAEARAARLKQANG